MELNSTVEKSESTTVSQEQGQPETGQEDLVHGNVDEAHLGPGVGGVLVLEEDDQGPEVEEDTDIKK